MYQLIYISSATKMLSRIEFIELASHAKMKNIQMGITGIFMFKEGNFMQVLEGEQSAIAELYSAIQVDARHTLVSVIQEGAIDSREYPSWSSSYFNADEGRYELIC